MPLPGTSASVIPSFWLSVSTLCFRELRGFYRQKSRVIGSLATPLLFWFVLGSGFGSSLLASEGGYMQFFFPGTLLLVVLFTSIFANISLIEDRHEGFLLSVLVAPVSRLSIVLGKVIGATTLGAIQGVLLLPLAPLAGVNLEPAQLPAIFGVVFLLAFGLTSLGFFCAWWLNSVQGFHSIMNLVFVPLWLMSGSVFPLDGSSFWVRWLTVINPLTYGVTELRRLFDLPQSSSAQSSMVCWIVMIGFCVLMLGAAWYRASRTEAGNLS